MNERDSIDDHVARWMREMPELDPRVEGIIGRISVVSRHLHHHRDQALVDEGLTTWEFQTLKDLRRRGAPYRATPGEMATALDLSPAAMTKRIDAMERSGYVRREHDTDDRRRLVITLTDAGLAAWRHNIDAQDRVERQLLAALGPAEQDQLTGLLRRLVLSIERPA